MSNPTNPPDAPWWLLIVTAFITAISSAPIQATFRAWRARRAAALAAEEAGPPEDPHRAQWAHAFEGKIDISSLLNKLQVESGAATALLLRSRNGGGRPGPGVRLKSSVVREIYSGEVDPVSDEWQHQELDEWYTALLDRVVKEGQVQLNVEEDMGDGGGMLGAVYRAHGVKYSVVIDVYPAETEYYYLSVTWAEVPPDTEDAKIQNAIRVARTTLRSILEPST